MSERPYHLSARVSTENPSAVRPVLEHLFPGGAISLGNGSKEFVVDGRLVGPSARELNRALLTSLRRAEKRTRLRAEWTCDGISERFFDYVPKGKPAISNGVGSPSVSPREDSRPRIPRAARNKK